MDTAPSSLMDGLIARGYWPMGDDTAPDGTRRETYDLTVSGIGTVRVCRYPGDDYRRTSLPLTVAWACDGMPGSPGPPRTQPCWPSWPWPRSSWPPCVAGR